MNNISSISDLKSPIGFFSAYTLMVIISKESTFLFFLLDSLGGSESGRKLSHF